MVGAGKRQLAGEAGNPGCKVKGSLYDVCVGEGDYFFNISNIKEAKPAIMVTIYLP